MNDDKGPHVAISRGPIKIGYSAKGISIFYDNIMITKNPGLNVAVNTLGLWTDSSKAGWHVAETGENFLKVKMIFNELPLSQIWCLKIENGQNILWQIEIELEEELYIDEIRIISMINQQYKMWINDYRYAYFPRMDNNWHDLCRDDCPVSLIGAMFPTEDLDLPPFTLEAGEARLLPLVQNPPSKFDGRIIGFRHVNPQDNREYAPGRHMIFSGRAGVYEKVGLMDDKIERLRQNHLKNVKKETRVKSGKAKVLLVNLPWQSPEGLAGVRAGSRWPHIKDHSEGRYLPFPFFLAYATSLLRKNGIDAELIDAIANDVPKGAFLDELSRKDFDIMVAETSVPSFNHDMKILKKISSFGIPIIMCGPHSEIYNEKFLKEYKFVNFILFGEYELTLLELVQHLQKGLKDLSDIKGLIWRDEDDNVIKNSSRPPFDINDLPWPYREGLPMEKYWDLPGDIPYPSVQMVASRGCPFSCSFCLWPQVLFGGRTYRTRDVNDVINEMEYLIKGKNFKSVYFDDDTFNIGKKRIMRLCEGIIGKGLSDTQWAIMAKPDLMDEEILETMKKAGLYAVKYGVESASQELTNSCNKKLDLEKTKRVIEFTKSLDVKVHLTFAFGLPGETKDTIAKTIDFAMALDPASIQFSIITPFPGTPLFEELDNCGRIITKDWSLYDGHYCCVFRPENLLPEDLIGAKEYAYKRWTEHIRKKRGFIGDVNRFLDYARNYGLTAAVEKTGNYLRYLMFYRNKFMGKI